jgi:GWxTD domain-containing protein
VAQWRQAIADSTGGARMSSGAYRLEVRAGAVAGRVEFSLQVPFFLSEEEYREKVDELLYVASQERIRELKQVPRDDRESAWRAFWQEQDPSPTTERNEREDSYFERIEYAKQHFAGADRGYRSDRAKVYVRLGPPDNIDSRPFEIDSRPYEVWSYYNQSMTFTFVDRYGFGEYVLVNPQSLER